VTIGEDQSALGVDHEAGGLRRSIPLGIERARLVDLDGDHALRDAGERATPSGALTLRLGQCGLRRGSGLTHHLGRRVLRPCVLQECGEREDEAEYQPDA